MNEKSLILVIDDEEHLRLSLSDYLRMDGFEVLTARSGEDGLKEIERRKPDLIVLDISMPGIGGIGFLKAITGPDGKPAYPVIVLTARSQMKDFFGTLDVEAFFAKPANELELSRKIRQVLARRQGAAEKTHRTHRVILLAEDDPERSQRLGAMLQREGFSVTVVTSGPEVLEQAPATRPDLFLLKDVLPRMNGSAIAAVIEVMPSLNSTPVVLYHDAGHVPERARSLRCVRDILPMDPLERVLAAVRACMG